MLKLKTVLKSRFVAVLSALFVACFMILSMIQPVHAATGIEYTVSTNTGLGVEIISVSDAVDRSFEVDFRDCSLVNGRLLVGLKYSSQSQMLSVIPSQFILETVGGAGAAYPIGTLREGGRLVIQFSEEFASQYPDAVVCLLNDGHAGVSSVYVNRVPIKPTDAAVEVGDSIFGVTGKYLGVAQMTVDFMMAHPLALIPLILFVFYIGVSIFKALVRGV